MSHDKLGCIGMIAPKKAYSFEKLPMVLKDIFLILDISPFPLRLAKPSPVHGIGSNSILLRKFFEKVGIILRMVTVGRQVKNQGVGTSFALLAIGCHLKPFVVDAFYQVTVVVLHRRERFAH